MLSLFDRLDTNHDGILSPAERQARQPGAILASAWARGGERQLWVESCH
jgi:hypothetical protein